VENSLPLDREDTLKKAEKLLRQGRLDARHRRVPGVVEDQPRDWNTANNARRPVPSAPMQADKAVDQYARIADSFLSRTASIPRRRRSI
jgi:hypothetical protein